MFNKSAHPLVVLTSQSKAETLSVFIKWTFKNAEIKVVYIKVNGRFVGLWMMIWRCFGRAAEMQARQRTHSALYTAPGHRYISIVHIQTFSLGKRAFPWKIRWQKASCLFVWSAAKMNERVFKQLSHLTGRGRTDFVVSVFNFLSSCEHIKTSRVFFFFFSLLLARRGGISTLECYTQHSSMLNSVHVGLYNFGFRLRQQSQIPEHYWD